ncbi:MAG: hypothetical protein SGJ20_08345, partial [Planctomycetota bacterium]|nr:hypothetical protein [Planctomycetota bacterium]
VFTLVVILPQFLKQNNRVGGELAEISMLWQTLLVMGCTTAIWVTVALLTKPEPDAVLQSFYRRAHPLGYWGPVRISLHTGDEIHAKPITGGN